MCRGSEHISVRDREREREKDIETETDRHRADRERERQIRIERETNRDSQTGGTLECGRGAWLYQTCIELGRDP